MKGSNNYQIDEREYSPSEEISFSSAGWGSASSTYLDDYNDTSEIYVASLPANTLWKYNLTFTNYDVKFRRDYFSTARFYSGKYKSLNNSLWKSQCLQILLETLIVVIDNTRFYDINFTIY